MNARHCCRNYIPQLLPEVCLVVHSIGVIALLLKSKVENILKVSMDSISSPSVKIQIMGAKVCLRCRGKTLLGIVKKILKTKRLLTSPSNVLPLHLKQTFPPII
jgi:hypothetical protein